MIDKFDSGIEKLIVVGDRVLIKPNNRYSTKATDEVIKIIRQTVRKLNEEDKWRGTLLLDKEH